ncbi:high-affinity branched-chain amino acid ABC transporter permease LivM [Enterovirga rhinocerotis]|uniref:Branched-chain amino acid transport system permease protein n=1 Tax=Enterovirga rhinocerotis TaxID=1339210 RepID=A0A4R7BVZ1_9HYPH|nr:high-affinity branched-chain amino acid ABC transporter permease LivM [Enterovirga rhinocerotis]TDR89623.1 branched-chain amino acid transport system permease protein [Enterovirga rhinocerotis]
MATQVLAPQAGALAGAPPAADLRTALRSAGFAALIMFGLTIPIVALRTDQGSYGLALTLRPHAVALMTAIVFVVAFARAIRLRRPERLGGPSLPMRIGTIVGIGLLLWLTHGLVAALTPPIAGLVLPGVALSFMPHNVWLIWIGVIFAIILIQGVVVPAVPGLVEATQRSRARSEKDAVRTVADPAARSRVTLGTLLKFAFLGLAVFFPAIMAGSLGGLNEARYWIDLGILVLTYVMLGWGLNIVVGLAGLLDLGYVAFYAVGAYSYALLSTTFGLSFWICLPLAGILAAFWGILLGFPVLRLRGDYLAIVTLAFGEIIRLVLINWVDVTGGGAGISSIPRVTFFGIPFTADEDGFAALFGLTFTPMHRILFLYYLILVLALVTNAVTVRLRRLPVGRAWEALREDEIACRSLGINTTITKLTAFAIGAMFGGFAGSFFAVRQGFISPESFTFLESAIVLAIVVLGGMGSQIGVAIAAIFMTAAPELLRNLHIFKEVGFDPTELRLILFGLAMVLMMIWRPRGLISVREPSVILKERKAISGTLVKEGHG